MNATIATGESISGLREAARRERLVDMELRLRRYRAGCFAILALALVALSPELGWWWALPLAVGFAGFGLADRFVRRSARPALWVAAAWGLTVLLLAGAVVGTGGAESPALAWFALPAVTLGARFEPRGIAIGTALIGVMLLAATYGSDPTVAAENHSDVVAALALVFGTVILSGALVESDRAHRRDATVDPLTGLLNRAALDQHLGDLEHGHDGEVSMLLCDLDHFKLVNDELGHAAGDTVLQEVSYEMRSNLRAGDSIYRVGGEEILIVLPGATHTDAVQVAERLRRAVHELRPIGVSTSISIGVAAFTGGPEFDSDYLVRRADDALYAAKANGRDRVYTCVN